MRRRARRMRRVREAELRDLGLLVLELERRGRRNPELLSRKASEINAIDDELRGIAAALREHEKLEQLVTAGIAGTCSNCGSLLGTDDRFCSGCGASAAQAAQSSPLIGAAPEPR